VPVPAGLEAAAGRCVRRATDGTGATLAVLDAAYRPRETALLAQCRACARSARARADDDVFDVSDVGAGRRLVCLEGIDMLVEQGLAQFELWTGCPAPREAVAAAAHAFYAATTTE